MVAEKGSIAETLANAFAGHKVYRNKDGVYEFDGEWSGRMTRFYSMGLAGHLFTSDFPEEYSN